MAKLFDSAEQALLDDRHGGYTAEPVRLGSAGWVMVYDNPIPVVSPWAKYDQPKPWPVLAMSNESWTVGYS